MTHSSEIKRWADAKDGTGVWEKDVNNNSEWVLRQCPLWLENLVYIVDDEFAELRIAYVDGADIEWQAPDCTWHIITKNILNQTRDISNLRIRLKEPVYEWQWYSKTLLGNYKLTESFFVEDEIDDDWVKFKPSKRERK